MYSSATENEHAKQLSNFEFSYSFISNEDPTTPRIKDGVDPIGFFNLRWISLIITSEAIPDATIDTPARVTWT